MTSKILDKIIKAQYRDKLADWEQYSRESEKIGLDIISQIYSSKGSKHLVIVLPKQRILYETHQSLMNRKNNYTLEQAQQMYRRKQLTSTYQYFHGASLDKSKKLNIFQFKTLQKLDLAKPLNPIAVSFIDNWLATDDRKEYQDYLLACLRSIKSKLQISNAGSTQMRTMYNWKEDPNLSKPIRMDKIGEDIFAFKPNFSAIRKQQEKQKRYRERIAEIEKTDFAKQISIFKDFKIN